MTPSPAHPPRGARHHRHFSTVDVGEAETEAFWRSLLPGLVERVLDYGRRVDLGSNELIIRYYGHKMDVSKNLPTGSDREG